MTEPAESKLLKQIHRHAAALNQQADRATEYIRRLDVELEAAGPGVEVVLDDEILMPDHVHAFRDGDEDLKRLERFHLAYARGTRTGRFALAVRTTTCEDMEGLWAQIDVKFAPLADADRATRLQAITHLPVLLNLIADELARQAEETKQSLITAGMYPTEV